MTDFRFANRAILGENVSPEEFYQALRQAGRTDPAVWDRIVGETAREEMGVDTFEQLANKIPYKVYQKNKILSKDGHEILGGTAPKGSVNLETGKVREKPEIYIKMGMPDIEKLGVLRHEYQHTMPATQPIEKLNTQSSNLRVNTKLDDFDKSVEGHFNNYNNFDIDYPLTQYRKTAELIGAPTNAALNERVEGYAQPKTLPLQGNSSYSKLLDTLLSLSR